MSEMKPPFYVMVDMGDTVDPVYISYGVPAEDIPDIFSAKKIIEDKREFFDLTYNIHDSDNKIVYSVTYTLTKKVI